MLEPVMEINCCCPITLTHHQRELLEALVLEPGDFKELIEES